MKKHQIEADFHTLMNQAGATANQYMIDAKRAIDVQFGKGFAAKNPTLVAAFMSVAANDFNTSSSLAVYQELVLELTSAIYSVQFEK